MLVPDLTLNLRGFSFPLVFFILIYFVKLKKRALQGAICG